MALQTVFRDDGVGYQRVRRHDAAEQQGGLTRVVEQMDAGIIDHDEGDKEREQSENRHFPEVLLGALHVHFKSGKEHDEIETHLSEDFERGIALQYVQPASTIPMMCGMRSLAIIIGANRMMLSTMKKIHVGSVMGK